MKRLQDWIALPSIAAESHVDVASRRHQHELDVALGYVFTDPPLKLASGHFGLGHGSGAHAPDEYYVIESTNLKVQGFDGAVMSFVQYLYELAK